MFYSREQLQCGAGMAVTTKMSCATHSVSPQQAAWVTPAAELPLTSNGPEDGGSREPIAPLPLPLGWATTTDPSGGKPYFWHKTTQKVTWERPTEDTPIR